MKLVRKRIRPALLLALCLASAQAPGAPGAPAAPGGSAPALAAEARFEGTPAEAMAAIRRLSADEPERALLLARQLGDDETLAEPLRAEFRFAQGVVQADMGAPAAAIDPFLSARALAGPGELRDAATYDQGTTQLLLAEALREEAFRAMMDPAAAGDPTIQGAGADAKDPLAKPRAAYLGAKRTLLERLRTSSADKREDGGATVDVRANLELIQRRLREIDELQQDQQEQQQQQQGDEQSEPQDGDQQQSEGDQQQEQDDQQSKDDQQQQSEDAGDPGQDQQGQQSEPDPNAEQQEQGPPDSGQLPDVTETPGSADGQPAERLLSREEVLRLLDTLETLESEREAIEAQLRAVRRVPVDEDW